MYNLFCRTLTCVALVLTLVMKQTQTTVKTVIHPPPLHPHHSPPTLGPTHTQYFLKDHIQFLFPDHLLFYSGTRDVCF